MAEISIFDIVGPIMVGPSSSHTAGAVRLGLAASRILGEPPLSAQIFLHGSFAATYWGHKTDFALVAGLLGMGMADLNIPRAKEIAQERGLAYTMEVAELGDVHPNTAKFLLQGQNNKVEVVGASVGGGRIKIVEIDGFSLTCDGTYSVLLTKHRDAPGVIAEITRVLALLGVNIAFLEVSRKSRGSEALLVAQTDDPISEQIISDVSKIRGVQLVRGLPSF